MNFVKLLVISGLVFSSAQAFAHEHKDSACKTYWESCKDTKGKHKRMECVKEAAAADTTNGPACTAEMAVHEEHHHDKMHKSDDAAPAATTAPAAN